VGELTKAAAPAAAIGGRCQPQVPPRPGQAADPFSLGHPSGDASRGCPQGLPRSGAIRMGSAERATRFGNRRALAS
jgi:hypothetical protein